MGKLQKSTGKNNTNLRRETALSITWKMLSALEKVAKAKI